MESFAVLLHGQEPGVGPLLPLHTVFTETGKDQSYRLKEEYEEQQM